MNNNGALWSIMLNFATSCLALVHKDIDYNVFMLYATRKSTFHRSYCFMYYDNLETHRVAAGLKVAVLSRLADVSASTIKRIEKHEPSTKETLMKLINALNETTKYRTNKINPQSEIKAETRLGSSQQISSKQ